MITDKDKKTVLEALEGCESAFAAWQIGQVPGRQDDILALKQKVLGAIALLSKPDEEQKPEPVAWMDPDTGSVISQRERMDLVAKRRTNIIERYAVALGVARPVAPAPDMPIVTHLNIDLNASLETKQAVADVVKAAYNYVPPAPDEEDKAEGSTMPDWAACEALADVPAVHQALKDFSNDPIGDGGAIIMREVLEHLHKTGAFAPAKAGKVLTPDLMAHIEDIDTKLFIALREMKEDDPVASILTAAKTQNAALCSLLRDAAVNDQPNAQGDE